MAWRRSSNYNKLMKLLNIVTLISLSISILPVVSASSASASSPHDQYVSFSLTHRDAESSPLRSVEADPADLPEDMPMRGFVAAGRALTKRLDMRAGGRKPFVGKTSYAGDTVGDFFLTVAVGTPSQHLAFLLDTGSEGIWTQCSPCLKCTTTTAVRFHYHQSSSFRTYDPTLCISSAGLKTYLAPPLCRFQVSYLDGSAEDGFVSIDSFHLAPTVVFSKPFVFGCANFVNETVSTPSSGIIGLDAGPFSFTSQLFAANPEMPKKFAYCLPDRWKSLNMPGRIEFGNYKQQHITKMRYTPFAPPYSPLGSLYYYVKLEGIAVGETMIKVDVEAKGGTLFDSGSAITYLMARVYNGMLREMKRQTTHLGPLEITNSTSNGGSRLCYLVPLTATKPPNVPRITMHFARGVELQLGPASILRPFGLNYHNSTLFCLAFDSSTTEDQNIIGNYQQQDYLVEYNLETSSLGLAKAKCANYK